MANMDHDTYLSKQLDYLPITRANLIEAVRYLASAIEDGDISGVREHVEILLKATKE